MKQPRTDVTKVEVPKGVKALGLTKGIIAFIDDEDLEKVEPYTWYARYSATNKNWYADGILNNDKKGRITLHNLVMGNFNPNIVVDHIDHNTLNNTKKNLRACSKQQNMFNRRSVKGSSSKYLGVNWDKARSLWVAEIKINYKKKFLGRFSDEVEAAKVRDLAAKKYFGEFANLNFKQ